MPLWSALQTKVYTYTNRPDLAAETLAALRRALRTAHQSGKYWRDLDQLTLTGSDPSLQVQSYSLSGTAVRAVATIKRWDLDEYFSPVAIDDLVDLDGYARVNVYWGMGTTINVRAQPADSQYRMTYYRWPTTSGAESVDSWILDLHEDTVICMAAATVLGIVGEQEIKSRMDQLAALGLADLQQDSLEVYGR
jgi:hypothetical protein